MISFIYFDIGGVLLKDYSGNNKWEEMKQGMGLTGEKSVTFEILWKKYQPRVCLDYDVDLLIPLIEEKCSVKFPAGYSLLHDFVSRFEINPDIWTVVNSIRSDYPAGLLTNMYPRMLDLIKKSGLLPDIEWDAEIDSSVVGFKKPDKRIFEIATESAYFPGEEILFVENSRKNTAAAESYGWQTYYYDSENYRKSTADLKKLFRISGK